MNTHVNADPAELAKFSDLAHRWWDADGEFRPLHQINPLRLGWMKEFCELQGKTVTTSVEGDDNVRVVKLKRDMVTLDGDPRDPLLVQRTLVWPGLFLSLSLSFVLLIIAGTVPNGSWVPMINIIAVVFMPIFIPLLPKFGIDPLFFGLLVALNWIVLLPLIGGHVARAHRPCLLQRHRLRPRPAIAPAIARASAADTCRHRWSNLLPWLRVGPIVQAGRGCYRDPRGCPAPVEGHPDRARTVRLPSLRGCHATAGTVPCHAARAVRPQPAGDDPVREVRAASAAQPPA